MIAQRKAPRNITRMLTQSTPQRKGKKCSRLIESNSRQFGEMKLNYLHKICRGLFPSIREMLIAGRPRCELEQIFESPQSSLNNYWQMKTARLWNIYLNINWLQDIDGWCSSRNELKSGELDDQKRLRCFHRRVRRVEAKRLKANRMPSIMVVYWSSDMHAWHLKAKLSCCATQLAQSLLSEGTSRDICISVAWTKTK